MLLIRVLIECVALVALAVVFYATVVPAIGFVVTLFPLLLMLYALVESGPYVAFVSFASLGVLPGALSGIAFGAVLAFGPRSLYSTKTRQSLVSAVACVLGSAVYIFAIEDKSGSDFERLLGARGLFAAFFAPFAAVAGFIGGPLFVRLTARLGYWDEPAWARRGPRGAP